MAREDMPHSNERVSEEFDTRILKLKGVGMVENGQIVFAYKNHTYFVFSGVFPMNFIQHKIRSTKNTIKCMEIAFIGMCVTYSSRFKQSVLETETNYFITFILMQL